MIMHCLALFVRKFLVKIPTGASCCEVCMHLHVPVWIYSRYFGFHPLSKHMHVRLIVDYKLPMDIR